MAVHSTPGATELERSFEPFRRQIVGIDQVIQSPFGARPLIYADWTASGRLHAVVERQISDVIGPFVANTHTEATTTGSRMTEAYHEAHSIIKRHVNAGPGDVIITAGSGMTAVVNKLIRILGLRVPEHLAPYCDVPSEARPVVFLTHMEHHSNQTTWIETIADVEVLTPNPEGLVDPDALRRSLGTHAGRPFKIGAFTASSNVTGIQTPVHALARIMHEHGGLCFVDYAASAPYTRIDMHPADEGARLDAVYFSPHKFLGGPGSPGVLVFDSTLYHNRVPDQPGGGTVNWTNPWKEHRFIDDIEIREDGGTPPFLQTIKAALSVRLKEAMGIDRILAREREQVPQVLAGLRAVPGLRLLAPEVEDRLGIFSFYIDGLHYNLVVKLLNDRFGVQTRGGCSCAGTYGHYLLNVDPQQSRQITERIDGCDLSAKPGWVRVSIHPTTTSAEIDAILGAIDAVARNGAKWASDYAYLPHTNEFRHMTAPVDDSARLWFDVRF
jgi:selenocysteine lyase/cysteine desulfurase